MAKASLTLPDGTLVQVEGTPEEVQKLLEFYRSQSRKFHEEKPIKHKMPLGEVTKKDTENHSADYSQIVNLVKDCDEAEAIEREILDRTSQVDRTLLPLYIVHEHLGNAFGLTSGEISKITTDLGIPISQPNASIALSGTASRYVIGDKVKKKGQAVRYTLSRRGVKYMKAVLGGTDGGK